MNCCRPDAEGLLYVQPNEAGKHGTCIKAPVSTHGKSTDFSHGNRAKKRGFQKKIGKYDCADLKFEERCGVRLCKRELGPIIGAIISF